MASTKLQAYDSAFASPARTSSLYSDFRSQRTSNPEGYEANCKVWLNVFEGAARDHQLLSNSPGTQDRYVIHTGEGLSRSLASDRYGRPLALEDVIEYGIAHNVLLSKQNFLKAKTSIHSKSSIPTTWQMFSWGLSKIGFGGTRRAGTTLERADLVIIPLLEEAATSIIEAAEQLISSRATSVFTKDYLIDELASASTLPKQLSVDDWHILATYLSRDRQLIAYDAASQTVKFKYGSEAITDTITQEDIDTASLRALVKTLDRQVNGLQGRIKELDNSAHKAVTAKNTQAAKSALRSKKLAQTTLEQIINTLHQLEDVFNKIAQAADQVEIVRVMEAAGRTLNTLNERTGGVDKVHEVMDILNEQAMTTNEISQALNEDSQITVDEAEVEDELEILEESQRKVELQREEATKHAQLEREAEEIRIKLSALESPSKAAVKESTAQGETSPEHEATMADT